MLGALHSNVFMMLWREVKGCHGFRYMPAFEMAEVILLDTIPEKMRFPQILPVLFEEVRMYTANMG